MHYELQKTIEHYTNFSNFKNNCLGVGGESGWGERSKHLRLAKLNNDKYEKYETVTTK